MTIRLGDGRCAVLLLAVASLGTTTGCELIPGLLASSPSAVPMGPDVRSSSAPLTIMVDEVDGVIAGEAIDARSVEVTGSRERDAINLIIDLGDVRHTAIRVVTLGTTSSNQDPYAGPGDPPPGSPDAGPVPPGFADAGRAVDPTDDASIPDPPPTIPDTAQIFICTPDDCRGPDDFGLENAETADGRSVSFDASWPDANRIHVDLHYTEQH